MVRLPSKQTGKSLSRGPIFRRMARRLGELGAQKVRPAIGSETLKNALKILRGYDVDGAGLGSYKGDLYIPHYWAVYYHYGRRSLSKPGQRRRGGYFVFFTDPDDDPRMKRRPPVRRRDVRRLTKAEFDLFMKENRRRRRAGQPPVMVVTPFVGPLKAHPFFHQLTLEREAKQEIVPMFREWVRGVVPTDEDTAEAKIHFRRVR